MLPFSRDYTVNWTLELSSALMIHPVSIRLSSLSLFPSCPTVLLLSQWPFSSTTLYMKYLRRHRDEKSDFKHTDQLIENLK